MVESPRILENPWVAFQQLTLSVESRETGNQRCVPRLLHVFRHYKREPIMGKEPFEPIFLHKMQILEMLY